MGKNEGTWINYYSSGSKEKVGVYRNGRREGVWTLWYDTFRGGGVQARYTCTNGKEHGIWRSWYPNGRPEALGYLVEGRRNGPWTFFYDNGQRSMQKLRPRCSYCS